MRPSVRSIVTQTTMLPRAPIGIHSDGYRPVEHVPVCSLFVPWEYRQTLFITEALPHVNIKFNASTRLCESFNVVFSVENVQGWMNYELKRSGRGLIYVLSSHLPGRTRQIQEYFSQNSWCPKRDSNQAKPEWKSIALHLDQIVLWKTFRLSGSEALVYLHLASGGGSDIFHAFWNVG
jgi:hypothetical protein